jgi:lysophospholipase L1-like esterase
MLVVGLASACLCLAEKTVQAQVRILPLGDSVTSSFSPHDSYRRPLWQKLTSAGFNVEFVGTQNGVADGPPADTDFDMNHEGHPGWTTMDGLSHVDSIAAATQPDIVLLDLGANDVIQGVPIPTIIDQLKQIIDHLRAANPNVKVLVAEPTPYIGSNSRQMSKLKGAIGNMAKHESQPGSKVKAVNLFGGFSVGSDTFDGMHPNDSGEKKIANRFFSALKSMAIMNENRQ